MPGEAIVALNRNALPRRASGSRRGGASSERRPFLEADRRQGANSAGSRDGRARRSAPRGLRSPESGGVRQPGVVRATASGAARFCGPSPHFTLVSWT